MAAFLLCEGDEFRIINEQMARTLDNTISEGQTTTFTFDATLHNGNQLNGTEKCQTQFDGEKKVRDDWEASFMLFRKP